MAKQNRQANRSRCFLLWNGLGGYCSLCEDFSVNRADAGVLVAAVKAPNERITLVHSLAEHLQAEGKEISLSPEICNLEDVPFWRYEAEAVFVERTCAMVYGENTTAVVYHIQNERDVPCTFTATPYLKFAPKEIALEERKEFILDGNRVTAEGYTLYIHTEGEISPFEDWQSFSYPADEEDGRPAKGLSGSCCNISVTVPAKSKGKLEIVFSTEKTVSFACDILEGERKRLEELKENSPFSDPVAKRLTVSADSYIAKRDSTRGKTILAGYHDCAARMLPVHRPVCRCKGHLADLPDL